MTNRMLGRKVMLLTVVATTFAGTSCEQNGSRQAPSTSTAPPPPPPAAPQTPPAAATVPAWDEVQNFPPSRISWTPASEIEATYTKNELKADAAWKDKRVNVLGRVFQVRKALGVVSVILEGNNVMGTALGSVRAAMSANATESELSAIATLDEGDLFAASCVGQGKVAGPVFTDCELNWVQPKEAPEVYAASAALCVASVLGERTTMSDGGAIDSAMLTTLHKAKARAEKMLTDQKASPLSCRKNGIWLVLSCDEFPKAPECNSGFVGAYRRAVRALEK